MVVQTGRFGRLEVAESDLITISGGILGFPEYTKFCLVDPGDDVLIIWLQSLENPEIAIPLLEPKIFKTDYTVRLSAAELRELRLDNVNQSAVFTLLTIGEGIVTQIPALLISTATGIIVTRAASESSFGSDLTKQLVQEPRALAIAAGLLVDRKSVV